MTSYTVWVGGIEVNNFYLTREEASTIAEEYSNDGYEDVQIEEITK